MNITSKHIAALLAASAMSFGLAANAQQGPGGGMGPGMGMGDCPMYGKGGKMMGDPAARAEQHLAQFKTQLKITPQQEPLWQAFADQVKSNAGQMGGMHQSMRQQMTAPERMDAMLAAMKSRISAMESVHDSFKRLYDALTPEQKKVADNFHPFGGQMGQKRGPRGGAMGGGMGMGGPGGQPPGNAPAPR